jgi:hypothetical protein
MREEKIYFENEGEKNRGSFKFPRRKKPIL